MTTKSIDLAWITVKNLNESIQFFTDIVGLKLLSHDAQYNWAELGGADGGAVLGIEQHSEFSSGPPGRNAVMTMTVENIQKAKTDFEKKNAAIVGDVLEIPGHVKLLSFVDLDGNEFQLVEKMGE